MFLCAKTASAATAALGFAGYILQIFGLKSLVIAVAAVVAPNRCLPISIYEYTP